MFGRSNRPVQPSVAHRVATHQSPKDGEPNPPGYKNPSRNSTPDPTTPSTLPFVSIHANLHSNNPHFTTMASNGYPEFNIDDALDNFGSFDYNLGFDGFGPDLLNTASPSQPSTATGIWEGLGHLLGPSDVAGPSRLYTGLEVRDELNSYPDFDLAPFNPMPSMHLGSPIPPPAPTLSLGGKCLPISEKAKFTHSS